MRRGGRQTFSSFQIYFFKFLKCRLGDSPLPRGSLPNGPQHFIYEVGFLFFTTCRNSFAPWRLCEKKTLKNYRSTSRYRKKLFNINCLFIDSYEIIILISYKIYNFSHYAGGIERLNGKDLLHLSNHYPFQHPRFPVYFHRCISKEIPTHIIALYVATQFRVVA